MSRLFPEWQSVIEAILRKYVPDRRVVLFGSRARQHAKKYSDIDLCILGEMPVPSKTMSTLREAFSSSDLPVRVDVVDWASTSPEFQKVITQQNELIYPT